MKYRPSKRVLWLVIPLLPVAIMSLGIGLIGEPDPTIIATRGATPPRNRISSGPLAWYDDGVSAVMTWDKNPWKIRNDHDFGAKFYVLKVSQNPEDQKKYRNLMKLAKEWHERLLARYPELATTSEALPPERNGLLQWLKFEKRLAAAKPHESNLLGMPGGFSDHFRNPLIQPWDPQATRDWLDKNRALLDEARKIALMPEQSSGGISTEDRSAGYSGLSNECAKAFLMEARLFAEQGDVSSALESIRAAIGISDHLQNGGSPTFMEAMRGAGIRNQIQSYVFAGILPSLPAERIDISTWEKAVNPTLQQPADFSRMVRGEWNTSMRESILPTLSDPSNPDTPSDPESLAEAYTQHMKSLATKTENLPLTDLHDNPTIRPSYSDLSWRSRNIARDMGMTPDSWDIRNSWERSQIRTGMTQAAFAILKGQPIPNDPISGQPYRWDSTTRKLSLPEIPAYRGNGIKPIVLPKL